MNTVTINGTTITGGRSISVSGNRVIVDGVDVTPDAKNISIEVHGAVDKLEVDHCDRLIISGDVNTVKTMSGDVEVAGMINGSVNTMSGDVECGNIGGSVSTMSGDIKHRK